MGAGFSSFLECPNQKLFASFFPLVHINLNKTKTQLLVCMRNSTAISFASSCMWEESQVPVPSFRLQEGTPQVFLLRRICGCKFKYCDRAIRSSVRKSIRMVKFLEAWGYAHRTQQQFGKPGCVMRLPGEARFCKGSGFLFYFDADFALGFSLPRCRPQSACLAAEEEKGISCQDSFQWLLEEPLFSRLPPRILLVITEKGGKGVKLPV